MAKVLVTGASGCIGAWVVRRLVEDGHTAVATDVSTETHRLDLLVTPLDPGEQLISDRLDVCDSEAIDAALQKHAPDAVIHLAALQLPICRESPIACADINVRGMLNFLVLNQRYPFRFVYASSTAVYGPSTGRPIGQDENLAPLSLYGVFKRANEEMARVWAQDYGVASVGIRPWTVYGPARDRGLTADVTHALYHAARDEDYHIRFSGLLGLEHADEVAAALIQTALVPKEGARVYTLGGPVAQVSEIADLIGEITGRRHRITVDPKPLGFDCETTDAVFQSDYGPFPYRSLEQGLRDTLDVWRSAGMV